MTGLEPHLETFLITLRRRKLRKATKNPSHSSRGGCDVQELAGSINHHSCGAGELSIDEMGRIGWR